jgi:hypothetical protein
MAEYYLIIQVMHEDSVREALSVPYIEDQEM